MQFYITDTQLCTEVLLVILSRSVRIVVTNSILEVAPGIGPHLIFETAQSQGSAIYSCLVHFNYPI